MTAEVDTTAPPRERLVRLTPAARFIGVHPDTLRRWTDRKIIRHYRLGPRRDRYFDRSDLVEHLQTHRRDAHV
jgi:excisionase family DNA binding protein